MSPGSPLADFLARYERLFILTGAGCSTRSGIPDYRDDKGDWHPVQHGEWLEAWISDAFERLERHHF